ncbi:MAG: hypothetical protein ACWA5P_00310 [bacterium]
MLKVDRDELLEEKEGKWYWKESEELFSGMMIYFDDDAFFDNLEMGPEDRTAEIVENGIVIKPYRSEYFSKYKYADYNSLRQIEDGEISIRENEIEREIGRYLIDDSLVTASTVGCYKGYLRSEYLFINGNLKFTIFYRQSGEMESFEYREDGEHNNDFFRERYEWHQDGSYKVINLGIQHTFFDMECPEPNILRSLWIKNHYNDNIEKLKEESFIGLIEDKAYYKQFKTKSFLMLAGEGINDEIFYNIKSNEGMEELEELHLSDVSFGQESYYALLHLPKLKIFSLNVEIDMMSDLADTIKYVAKELKKKGVEVSLEVNGKRTTY